jgi:hypothetical protein
MNGSKKVIYLEEKTYPYLYTSRKIPGGSGYCRSKYEEYIFNQLKRDTEVKSFQIEPFKIPYSYGDRTRMYTPDILVTFQDGSKVLVEVKVSQEVLYYTNQKKFEAAERFALENGMKFEVWTTPSLANSTPWSNIRGRYDYKTLSDKVISEAREIEKSIDKRRQELLKQAEKEKIIGWIIFIAIILSVLYAIFTQS